MVVVSRVTTLSACPELLAICGASSTVPSESSTSGEYPSSPTAPGLAAAGGNPVGPATTNRCGLKSTDAGKSSWPADIVTRCTAAIPRALASLFERLAPYFDAALLVDASRTTNHTVRPWLTPWCNGSVTVPSACSTALGTKTVRPEPTRKRSHQGRRRARPQGVQHRAGRGVSSSGGYLSRDDWTDVSLGRSDFVTPGARSLPRGDDPPPHCPV